MKRIFALMLLFSAVNASAAVLPLSWSDVTTAAATGYCLAKHPYATILTGSFTPDGYEIVSSPGIVGAVRRNYIYDRATTEKDEGEDNTCKNACVEFGRHYTPYWGAPLHQQVRSGGGIITINSGIGDMASLAARDQDFYLGADVIAGIWSRGNTWHESDVAQADFCCCQVVKP